MRIKILNPALEDLYKGRLFYEEQNSGLGEYFFNSLFSDIDSLTHFAGVHIKVFGDYRKLSQKLPYAICFKIEDSAVIVRRVLDLRRDPETIRKTLG